MFILIVLLCITFASLIFLVYKYKILDKKYRHLLQETKEDTKVLFLKSKYTSMGETIGNIAHQWKQPLNAIGSIQNSIKAALIFQGEISKEKLLQSVDTSFKLLQHLAETIDTFYNFLSYQNSTQTSFLIADELEKVRKITEYSFENSNIALTFELEINPSIQGNANEFTHAMLNIILNAKDAFENGSVTSPKIKVHVMEKKERCIIIINDNAGGIRLDPIDMVFDLHITTKESGSGLGLFMTKNIIENRFGGKISALNINQGACFTIELPYAEYGEQLYDIVTLDEKTTLERINKLSHKIIELEEVEKALKMWADIFKHARWGIAIYVETSKCFEMTNSAFHSLYGYTTTEIQKLTLSDFFTPETLPFFLVVQEEALKQGYAVLEAVHKRKDGTKFPVSIEFIVVKDDTGKVLYIIANIWDLTERKQIEENLLLKEFALNKINEAVYLIDEHSMFHYVNEAACKSLGYKEDELLKMGVSSIDPNVPPQIWGDVWRHTREKKLTLLETHHKRKDGVVFPIEVIGNYIEYQNIGYSLATVRDMTERIKVQIELKEREEKFSKLFMSSPAAVSVTSLERNIYLEVNESFLSFTKYTREEVIGKSSADLQLFANIDERAEFFRRVLEEGIVRGFEFQYRAKDGISGYGLAFATVVYIKGEKCVLSHSYDINARKQLELVNTAVNSTSEAIYIMNEELSIIYVNDGACNMLGFTKEELTSMKVCDIDINSPEDEIFKIREKIINTEKIVFNTRHRRKNGDIIDVEIQGSSFTFNNKRVELAVVKDITQLKERESKIEELNKTLEQKVIERTKELEKALEFSKSIIQAIPDMLFEISKEGVYLNIWARDEKLLASQKEMLLGKNFKDILPPEAVKVSFKTMDEVDMYGSSLGNTYKLDLPDGERWFELHTTKKEPEGTYLALVRDVTDRKKAKNELIELNATLEEKVKARTIEL